MTSTVLWVVGEPGVGKTTLVRTLLDSKSRLIAKPKWTLGDKVAAAGHYSGLPFDGADTVPYNGVEAALGFWCEMIAPRVGLTILDGDRFSNGSARAFFMNLDKPPRQRCVLLSLKDGAEARRRARGSTQNASWVQGRVTKARRFFEGFEPEERQELDGAWTTAVQREALLQFLGK